MTSPVITKRFCLSLPLDLVEALQQRKIENGISMAEFTRRSLRLTLFADRDAKCKQDKQ
jgi:Ribbon-helix-helix protein, copG family